MSGPIAVVPTRAELVGRCLVDGRRGRRPVPEAHDRVWILTEAQDLAAALRNNFQTRWAKHIEEGVRRAEAGSLHYLGHALEMLQRWGPRRRNRDRVEDLIVAIGRLW